MVKSLHHIRPNVDMAIVPPGKAHETFAFVVCTPLEAQRSNGTAVVINLAKNATKLGCRVVIIPGHSLQPQSAREICTQIDGISLSWQTPKHCIAIICDTISPERLGEVRERASTVMHYSLAPKGLFQSAGPSHYFEPLANGEKSAVYSPQVSTRLPHFYLQTEFQVIDSLIATQAISPTRSRSINTKGGRLTAAVYAGKGRLQPIHNQTLQDRIARDSLSLITRRYPRGKAKLYELLSHVDLLISFDPITSLNHESILLGTPVLVIPPWDEEDFRQQFPVCLDGIAWGDPGKALEFVDNGYDLDRVRSTYSEAIKRNLYSTENLLRFASTQSHDLGTVEKENEYWRARQFFFRALALPSQMADEWCPAEKIIPLPNQQSRKSILKRRLRQVLILARSRMRHHASR